MFMGSLRAFWLNVNVFMILLKEISLLQNPTMPLKTVFSLQVAQWKMHLSRLLRDGEQSSLLNCLLGGLLYSSVKWGRSRGMFPVPIQRR